MSPTLATRTTDPGAGSSPIPPADVPPRAPARLDELLAELAIAEKWPTPKGYCHRCGLNPCYATSGGGVIPEEDGTCSYDLTEPPTLDTWLTWAAGDAMNAVFRYLPHDVRRVVRSQLAGQVAGRIAYLYNR